MKTGSTERIWKTIADVLEQVPESVRQVILWQRVKLLHNLKPYLNGTTICKQAEEILGKMFEEEAEKSTK